MTWLRGGAGLVGWGEGWRGHRAARRRAVRAELPRTQPQRWLNGRPPIAPSRSPRSPSTRTPRAPRCSSRARCAVGTDRPRPRCRRPSGPRACATRAPRSTRSPGSTRWRGPSRRCAAATCRRCVLARDVHVWSEQPLQPLALARRLAAAQPDSWTFCIDGLVGATPELLLRRRGREVTSLVLAGTTARGRDGAEDTRLGEGLLASDKDREEHAHSVASVRDGFAAFASGVTADPAPHLLRLPHVQHLATWVRGTVETTASALELAGSLHPTAAICGTPTAQARALIGELERLDRARYTGPVGWVDAQGDGEFGIALRCAEVTGTRARIFAGVGIVGGLAARSRARGDPPQAAGHAGRARGLRPFNGSRQRPPRPACGAARRWRSAPSAPRPGCTPGPWSAACTAVRSSRGPPDEAVPVTPDACDGGEVDAVRGAEEALEAVGPGLRQLVEDPAAVVVHHDQASGGTTSPGPRIRPFASCRTERSPASATDRTLPGQGRAERRRDEPVDPAGPAVADHGQRPRHRVGVEVANRPAGGRDEQRVVRAARATSRAPRAAPRARRRRRARHRPPPAPAASGVTPCRQPRRRPGRASPSASDRQATRRREPAPAARSPARGPTTDRAGRTAPAAPAPSSACTDRESPGFPLTTTRSGTCSARNAAEASSSAPVPIAADPCRAPLVGSASNGHPSRAASSAAPGSPPSPATTTPRCAAARRASTAACSPAADAAAVSAGQDAGPGGAVGAAVEGLDEGAVLAWRQAVRGRAG